MEFYIGQIFMGGWNFNPMGSAYANGALLSISQYDALFSLYGTTFGGDGRTTFGLPDLRGRVPVHRGSGQGLTPRNLGAKGGAETNPLTIANLPAHSHTLMAAPGTATSGTADGNTLAHETRGSSDVPDIYENAVPTIAMHDGCASNTGSGTINNVNRGMQPFQVISFCVALQGIYPSRT